MTETTINQRIGGCSAPRGRKATMALCLATLAAGLSAAHARAATFIITADSDEGTEINRSVWAPQGLTVGDYNYNFLGRAPDSDGDVVYETGLRFILDGLSGVDQVEHARLRFSSRGSDIDSAARLAISGVLQSDATTFSDASRPSQKLPRTSTSVNWTIDGWIRVGDYDPLYNRKDDIPLFYHSPDISGIINEFASSIGMADQQPLVLAIDEDSSPAGETNLAYFEGYEYHDPDLPYHSYPVELEVYPTVYDTFVGKELLGRVTDSSAVVMLYSLIDTDVYVEYGAGPGQYTGQTPPLLGNPADTPITVELSGLQADTEYYYRLAHRRAGVGDFEFADEHSFHTQRLPGTAFKFSITADEHLQNMMVYPPAEDNMALYRQTLDNVAAGEPDFWISLGDFSNTEFITHRDVVSQEEAVKRYLDQRDYIDRIGHSIPFYLTIGNHEGEQGWYYDFANPGGNTDSLAVWSTKARKQLVPNPRPDNFYSGNQDVVAEFGLREDYYAWEWGDALFVVIDPYPYTETQPGDDWEWTLGHTQYEWLYQTLHGSDAKWKFVFTHQLTSSYNAGPGRSHYGRGGIEVAKYKVDQKASYEWGGEDGTGAYVFDQMRPGWDHGAIHDMLYAEGVNAVFHGHDHGFVKQDLDGIVYLECPKPGDAGYSYGLLSEGGYVNGDLIQNSGHIEVSVADDHVQIDYVRAYLPGDGANGEVAYTAHVVDGDLDLDGDVDLADLGIFLADYPNSQRGVGDLDRDDDTDLDDLIILLANYGAEYSQ